MTTNALTALELEELRADRERAAAGVPSALETCNACDVNAADPASPGGYCSDCEREARSQPTERTDR